MRNIGRFGIETTGGQNFQLGAVKCLSIAGRKHARQDCYLARIRMRVRADSESLWKFETQRIWPRSRGIAYQVGLHAENAKMKLKVSTRAEAVAIAVSLAIVMP
jgi:hypothetical protein